MENKEFYSRSEVDNILNDYLIKTSEELVKDKKNNKIKDEIYV